jgi:hypothetical protein
MCRIRSSAKDEGDVPLAEGYDAIYNENNEVVFLLGSIEEQEVDRKIFFKRYYEALRLYEKAYELYLKLGISYNENLRRSPSDVLEEIERLKRKMKYKS